MPIRLVRLAAAVCLSFFMTAAWAVDEDVAGGDPGWEKKSDQWIEKVDAGGTVRVVNPYGNIYARFGGYENKVEILATTQIIDRSAPELVVRRVREGTGLDVNVVVEGFNTADTPPRGTRKDRVDLVLFIPQGAVADFTTAGGEVQTKGLKSRLAVGTVSGDIRIRSNQGPVDARSERGAISAMLENGTTMREQSFTTETGDIEIYLREDADAEFTLATSGLISTDFSLNIEYRPREEPGKLATGSVGSSGAPISLYSKRGQLKLLRLPRESRE